MLDIPSYLRFSNYEAQLFPLINTIQQNNYVWFTFSVIAKITPTFWVY